MNVAYKTIDRIAVGDVLLSWRWEPCEKFSGEFQDTDFAMYTDEDCNKGMRLVPGPYLVLVVGRISKYRQRIIVRVVSSNSSVGYLWIVHNWTFEVVECV
jgi:hypothetical protein